LARAALKYNSYVKEKRRKKMKRKIAIFIAMSMAVAMLGGCTGSTKKAEKPADAPAAEEPAAEQEAAEEKEDTIKIGFSMPSMISQYFEGIKQVATETAEEEGVELVIANADGDAATQKTQIQDLISGGCDVIVAIAQDSEAIVSSAADCAAAGVPFIALDREPTDLKDVSLFIGFSNEQSAGLCAQAMVDAANELGYEKVKVIEMIGDLNDTNAVERKDFFEKKAAELGIEIVAEVPTEWDVDTAFNRLTDTVQNIDEYNAIYCPSDTLLSPIMSVLTTRGEWVKFGEDNYKIITSIDGDPTGVTSVKEEYVYSTSNHDAFVIAKQSILSAIDVAKNGAPAEKKQPMESMLVTKEVAEEAGDTIWGNAFAE